MIATASKYSEQEKPNRKWIAVNKVITFNFELHM